MFILATVLKQCSCTHETKQSIEDDLIAAKEILKTDRIYLESLKNLDKNYLTRAANLVLATKELAQYLTTLESKQIKIAEEIENAEDKVNDAVMEVIPFDGDYTLSQYSLKRLVAQLITLPDTEKLWNIGNDTPFNIDKKEQVEKLLETQISTLTDLTDKNDVLTLYLDSYKTFDGIRDEIREKRQLLEKQIFEAKQEGKEQKVIDDLEKDLVKAKEEFNTATIAADASTTKLKQNFDSLKNIALPALEKLSEATSDFPDEVVSFLLNSNELSILNAATEELSKASDIYVKEKSALTLMQSEIRSIEENWDYLGKALARAENQNKENKSKEFEAAKEAYEQAVEASELQTDKVNDSEKFYDEKIKQVNAKLLDFSKTQEGFIVSFKENHEEAVNFEKALEKVNQELANIYLKLSNQHTNYESYLATNKELERTKTHLESVKKDKESLNKLTEKAKNEREELVQSKEDIERAKESHELVKSKVERKIKDDEKLIVELENELKNWKDPVKPDDKKEEDQSFAWIWISLTIVLLIAGALGYFYWRRKTSAELIARQERMLSMNNQDI